MTFFSLGISFLISIMLIPLVRWFSYRLGRVAMPRGDRWHQKPTPTLGGIGIFIAFAITVLVMGGLMGEYSQIRWALLGGSFLMFGLGLLDDLVHLSPPGKLIVQILAAAIVIFFGRLIDFFPWEIANIILTFFWLVGITNAINLLDNMDGLAAGVAFIAAAFLSYFFWHSGSNALLLVSLSLAGSVLGFLIFNFPPAKIFMGDSGSLFLGFTLAALAVTHRPRASDVFTVMGVPILLFLLPILDTSLVTITRLLRGQSPTQGGTDHTSHRLIAFGLSERQTVLILYAVGIISGVVGAVLESLNYELSLVLIPVLLITLSLITAYLGRLKVVSTPVPSWNNISRLVVNLTYQRKLLEIMLDFFLIGVSYYLAFWLRMGLQFEVEDLRLFMKTVPIALAGAYIAFSFFGVYRFLWRYVGLEDVLVFGRASLSAVLFMAAPVLILYQPEIYPPAIFFLYAIFLFLGLVASRGSFRVLDHFFNRRPGKTDKLNVLIYGVDDAGEIAFRWILLNPDFGYWPIGFIDDDPLKWGRRIQGVSVLGGITHLEEILANTRAAGIILTPSSLSENRSIKEVVETCTKSGVWVKVLRLDFDPME